MLKRYQLKNYDFKLILLLIMISAIGVLAVGSADESLQQRQLAGVALGMTIMVVISLIDYSQILRLYWVYYVLSIGMLAAVLIWGEEVNGATRWINIPHLIQFQPSEITKILLILFYAQFIIKHREKLNTFRILSFCVLLVLPAIVLLYMEPNLSTTILYCILFCVLMFVGGLSYKIIGAVLAVAVPSLAVLLYLVMQPGQTLIRGYQLTRILAWLNPEQYADTEAYQQLNSVMAIGSGQLWGKGLNNNVIASVKNGNFIPEPETDFIFAVIGEELGFVGSCAVIVLLFLLRWSAFPSQGRRRIFREPSSRPEWRRHRFSELHEHRCDHNDHAEYRNSASFRQLGAYVPGQSLHRNGIRAECPAAEEENLLV